MNSVVIIGRITKDIELRKTESGKYNCSFTLAVTRDKDNTDFINCQAWNMIAENMSKYCSKGDLIAVKGRIQSRSYDAQDGTKRYITEVIADNVMFLSTKPKEETKSDEFEPGNLDVEILDANDDELPF